MYNLKLSKNGMLLIMKLYPKKPYSPEESTGFILGNFREILEGKSFLVLGKFCLVGPRLISNRENLKKK